MFNQVEYIIKNEGYINESNVSDKYITNISKWTSNYLKRSDIDIIKKYSLLLHWCICNSDIDMYPINLRNEVFENACQEFELSFNELFNLFIAHKKYFNDSVKNPQIIAIEGIDGTGKTVQAELLNKQLNEMGYKSIILEYPNYSSFFGREIGALLSGKNKINANIVDSKSMSLWYALDRKRSLEDINLNLFDYVIFNRYTLSSAIYQGIRCDDDHSNIVDWIFALEHKELKLPIPDVYIVLDLSVQKSQLNVDEKGKREYIEEKDVYESSGSLLEEARKKYWQFSKSYSNIDVIDCSLDNIMRSKEDIADEIMGRLFDAEVILRPRK